MLHRLAADRASFRTLNFRPGLNILLATRADGGDQDSSSASARRSRNGAGKSSTIDLIHFLLGGKPEGALSSPALADWNFMLGLDVGRERIEVTRSVANAKQVIIRSPKSGVDRIPNAQWCKRLGEEWFGLREKRGNGDVSYRQLISYFARRKRDGGLDSPIRTFRNQSTASAETSLAHLFGLDAELVRRLQRQRSNRPGMHRALWQLWIRPRPRGLDAPTLRLSLRRRSPR